MSASTAGDGLKDVVDRLPAICHRARREYQDLIDAAEPPVPSDAPVHFLQVTEDETLGDLVGMLPEDHKARRDFLFLTDAALARSANFLHVSDDATIQEVAAMLPKDHPARVQLRLLAESSNALAQEVLDLHKELRSDPDHASAGPAATGGPAGASDGPTPEVQKGRDVGIRRSFDELTAAAALVPGPEPQDQARIADAVAARDVLDRGPDPEPAKGLIEGLVGRVEVDAPLIEVPVPPGRAARQRVDDEAEKMDHREDADGYRKGYTLADLPGAQDQGLGAGYPDVPPMTQKDWDDFVATGAGPTRVPESVLIDALRLEDARGRLARILYRQDHAVLGPDLVEELKQIRALLLPEPSA